MHKLISTACFLSIAALATTHLGTWKMNAAKSQYTGMPAPKEMTVVYTQQGSGWRYQGTGVSAAGEPIKSSYTYVKDGEEAKTTGFPAWDSMIITHGNTNNSNASLMRGGKKVGNASRLISLDGKTMTVRGGVTLPDGKQASFFTVYSKQ